MFLFQFPVQMFEGRRTLNWKYHQAMLMIEYFRDGIPKPFSILNVLPFVIATTRNFFKTICKTGSNCFKGDVEHTNWKRQRCGGKNTEERIKHANLMQTLINRLKVSQFWIVICYMSVNKKTTFSPIEFCKL